MKRRLHILLICLSLGLPTLSFAGSAMDMAVEMLRSQGFTQIEAHRTFLGRIRLLSVKGAIRRELIIHPFTGEVLRDRVIGHPAGTGNMQMSGQGMGQMQGDHNANDDTEGSMSDDGMNDDMGGGMNDDMGGGMNDDMGGGMNEDSQGGEQEDDSEDEHEDD